MRMCRNRYTQIHIDPLLMIAEHLALALRLPSRLLVLLPPPLHYVYYYLENHDYATATTSVTPMASTMPDTKGH